MNILSRIIYEQNKDLLKKIADDNFSEEDDKTKFISKYHKLNYAHLNTLKKDDLESYKRSLKGIVALKINK